MGEGARPCHPNLALFANSVRILSVFRSTQIKMKMGGMGGIGAGTEDSCKRTTGGRPQRVKEIGLINVDQAGVLNPQPASICELETDPVSCIAECVFG